MPQIIEVPGHGPVEFPDGMSDADIVSAIKRNSMGVKPPAAVVAPAAPKTFRQQLIEGLVPLARPGGTGTALMEGINRATTGMGEFVNDQAAKVLPPQSAAALGATAKVMGESVPMMIGGSAANSGLAPTFNAAGRWFMGNALKAPLSEMKSGDVSQAITTLLREGQNPNAGGVATMKGEAGALADQVKGILAPLTGTVEQSQVLSGIPRLLERVQKPTFGYEKDLEAVKNAASEFANHPEFLKLQAQQRALEDAVAGRSSAKVSALQDAGRYQTMAAQQDNLAHGGGVNLRRTVEGGPDGMYPSGGMRPQVTGQTLNEPFMNTASVASGGGRSLSPSAYPAMEGMIGQPRIPGRYTENIQRVPEAQSAASDFLRVVELRKAEEAAAQATLDAFKAKGGSTGISVQTAQEMKQANYKKLGDEAYSYLSGQKPIAGRDAVKNITSGLREGIEKVAPEVGPLNARQSDLINAISIAERRALMDSKLSPLSLTTSMSLIHGNPLAALGMFANGSTALKAYLARALYSGQNEIPAMLGRAGTVGALESQRGALYQQ